MASAKTIPLNPATIERFNAKVGPLSPNGCREWTGARKYIEGYGVVWIAGGFFAAHRVAYTIAHGPIASGMHVLHHCDNPPCVNDEHLFLGTDADNARDRASKGRPSGRSARR